MRISKREKILLSILLLLSLVYIYYNFFYKPVASESKRLYQENSTLKALIEKGEEAQAKNLKLAEKNTEMAKLGNELQLQIPTRPRVPETIAFLKEISQATQVDLQSVNFEAESKNGTKSNIISKKPEQDLAGLQVSDYKISLQGSYNNLLALLMKIEKAPRLYTISNCRMTINKKNFAVTVPSEVLPPTAEGQAEAADAAPLPGIVKSITTNDGNNILLELKFAAYFDEKAIPGVNTGGDEVPVASGKINPFL